MIDIFFYPISVNVKVIIHGTRSFGYGFLEYSNEDEANKAVEQMNHKELLGRKLIVQPARPYDPEAPKKRRFEIL